MKNLAKIFHYRQWPVRTFELAGEPWFVAADVCAILGLDTSLAVNGRSRPGQSCGLDPDEKGTAIISTPGGRQSMLIVSEPGLYSLILRSRKREAQTFRRWITHEKGLALNDEKRWRHFAM